MLLHHHMWFKTKTQYEISTQQSLLKHNLLEFTMLIKCQARRNQSKKKKPKTHMFERKNAQNYKNLYWFRITGSTKWKHENSTIKQFISKTIWIQREREIRSTLSEASWTEGGGSFSFFTPNTLFIFSCCCLFFLWSSDQRREESLEADNKHREEPARMLRIWNYFNFDNYDKEPTLVEDCVRPILICIIGISHSRKVAFFLDFIDKFYFLFFFSLFILTMEKSELRTVQHGW